MGTSLYRGILILLLISLGSCLDEPVSSSIEDYYLSSITSNNSYIFTVASDGRVFRSSDAVNWETLPINNDEVLLDIKSSPDGNVYACGEQGVFFVSSDNGETWSRKKTSTSSYLKTLVIYDDSTIFAGDNSGSFIKSTDKGETWTKLEVPFSYPISTMSLRSNQIYIGLRSNDSPTLLYKYDIEKDTISSVSIEVASFVSDISFIDGKIYFSDYSGTYELIENGQNISKQAVYTNTEKNFINQKTLKFDNKITLIGYYGFNLGEVIFDPQNSIDIKDFEESLYFNSGTIFDDKLLLCGGDEMEIAIYQNPNWKIIKLK